MKRAVSVWLLEGSRRDRCHQKSWEQRPIWSWLGRVPRHVVSAQRNSTDVAFLLLCHIARRCAISQGNSKTALASFINKASSLAQAMQAIPRILPRLPGAVQSRLLMHSSLSTSAYRALQHLRPCHKLHILQRQSAMLSMRHCETRLMKHIEEGTSTELCSFANQYVQSLQYSRLCPAAVYHPHIPHPTTVPCCWYMKQQSHAGVDLICRSACSTNKQVMSPFANVA